MDLKRGDPPPPGGEGLGVGGTPASNALGSPPPLPSPTRGEGKTAARRGFEATRAWVFDLDNTLYPAECNLFAQVDHRMGEFIARFLGVPYAYARHLQKSYYRQFGTTLSGLMLVHKMDPKPFLDYVHDIDLSVVDAHPDLAAAIEKLPGRKLIYTNGSRRHAERVAGKLGVLHLFEDIFDIVASEYVPKPQAGPYKKFLALHGVDPEKAAMFEDMPHNLAAAACARHDDRARAFELLRSPGAARDPQVDRAARARAPHDGRPGEVSGSTRSGRARRKDLS